MAKHYVYELSYSIGCAGQNRPLFDPGDYDLTINQNVVMNTAVLNVSCTYTGNVEYEITATSMPLFLAINSLSGEITLTLNAIDIEVGNYTVVLQCSDSLDSDINDLAFLIVSRVEENQFTPQFLNERPVRLSISEARNFMIDPSVVDIDTTDGDLGTFGSIEYTIQGDVSDTFSIDSQTGVVSLQSSLDFEAAAVHQFIVTASNPLDPRTGVIISAEILVITEVTNVNDEPPMFSENNYQQSVHETFAEGGFPRPPAGFLGVQCTDLDTDPTDITYSIAPDSDPGPFILDATTGSFSVTEDLDYETRTSYSFSITCFDNGLPNHTASALVDITISSVNEFEPEIISSGRQTLIIGEGIPIGTIITSTDRSVQTSATDYYEVTDQDTGPDGNVTYTLSDSNSEEDAQFFRVDLITGSLIVIAEPDVDTMGGFRSLQVLITACDSDPPRDVCPNILKTLLVFSADEHQPTFSQEDYEISYPESTPPITTIVTAMCEDGDLGTGMITGISFVNPAQEVEDTFYLDPETGDIVTIRTLDFETSQSYGFELRCTDNSDNEDRAVVSVTILAENDNEPRFQSESYEFFVSRTTPPNRYPIGSVVAIDEDIGVGGQIEYMFAEANGFFDITNGGVIELFNSVENYTGSFFRLDVRVSDGLNVDTAEVLLNLTAGNFIRPQFVIGSRAREVSELSPVGTSVISVLCNDTETGKNGEIRYSITGGNTDEAFQINPITGIISVANTVILPQNSSSQEYPLDVRCEDQGVPILSDDTVIFIRVFQDDSNPPDIGNETIVVFVSEDAEINHVVTVIEATDLDSEILRFRLENESVPNVFQIDPATGSVFVAALLNRELVSMYEMVVVVTEVRDPGIAGPERSDTAKLIIFIRDVNDNIPICENIPPVTIPEIFSPGAVILQLNCSDPDFGENGDIDYTLSNDFSVLSINAQGEIVLEDSLDLVIDINTLVFTVNVADQGIPQQLNSYSVTIFISSTNRNIPSFINLPVTIEVSEVQPIQEIIFTAQASDPDRGSFGQVSYEIINSEENEPFTIFPNTGGIVLTQKLNFFERPEYNLNISASDSDFTVTQILTVLVLDANEYTPECVSTFTTASIAENLVPNQLLSERLTCSDEDDGSNGEIVFRIRNGNEEDALDILSDGSILVLQTLDFENIERYELLVEVSDSGNPPLSVNVTVVVIVQPVNEHSPLFSETLYTAVISEDANLGMSVLQVSATDDDRSSHPHGQVVYTIFGLEQLVFSISSTGLIRVAGNLDREQRDFYSFAVQASDQGLPPRVSLTTVEINITDIDDSAPRFSQDSYIATLNLTTEIGAPVIVVTCSDPDLGINGAVTFSFDDSSDSQFFQIQPSGLITVEADLPISRVYSFTTFCIGLGPANFSDNAVISIQVFVDSNIRIYPSDASLPEDTVPVFNILQINATTSTNAELTYTLLSVSTPFSIDETTGYLRLVTPLDYETTRSYVLRVQVSDNGNPPSIGEALIQVTVENVNDEQPQITTAPLAINLPEGPTDGSTTIGQYMCTDADEDTFGQVAFRIESGNEEGLFMVSGSGTLQLIGELDYETTQSYILQLICEDGGIPPRADTIAVPIAVSPINDNSPMFTGDIIEISVTEALPLSSNIGPPIQATDVDLPPHNDLRYSIISGNSDPQLFAISSMSGQLMLVGSLDFESIASYTLVIVAQDNGGQVTPDFQVLNDTVSVILTVLDFNDNVPEFSQQIYTGTIQETASANDQVVLDSQVVCTDADSDSNGEVTLQITNGNTNDVFAVQDSGIIIVQTGLDFEEERNYQLEVECQDNGSPQLASQATVIISVLDFNEFGPEFNQSGSAYTFSISESTPAGTQIGRVFAVDQDAGEAGVIVYGFADDMQMVFSLNSDTGTITLIDALDYEFQSRIYVLEAIATDSAGLSDVVTVIIEVQNIDDNLPEFSQENYFASVPENAEPGTSVAQVTCSDADDQADGVPISVFLTDSSTPFQINDGRISVAGDLDLEVTPRYTLGLICTDSAGNVATATITVNLGPFNDFPPVFTGELPYTLALEENAMIGIPIFEVTAVDDDTGMYNDITYTFISGNDAGRFEIDSSTGIIRVSQSIDREEQSLYVIEVLAQNVIPLGDTSGSEPLSATTTLTIMVLDTNDNDPSIIPEEATVFIPEANSSNTIVEQFLCNDPDFGANGTTNFAITSENTADDFQILSDGTLVTTDTVTNNIVVVVTCFDNGTPQRSSRATVIIQTVSMNDHSPLFSTPMYVLAVDEDQPVGQDIECFEAVDMDGPESPDGILQYSLRPEIPEIENRFGIREDTGCVFVSIVLDFDVQSIYRYDIIAQDMGDPPLSGVASLVIVVFDVVRDPPMFVDAPYIRIVSEGVEVQTFIADATCTDQDVDDIISYSIAGGDNDGIFSIDNETGIIVLAQRLDFEASMSYSLLVECTDSFNLSDSTNVFITVTPVNEFTPAFQAMAVSVPEHSIGGTLVTQLEWTDADAGSDGEVTFNITSGNINTAFVITNDGRILVAGVLDREILNFYQLEVQIRDLAENPDERRSSVNHVNITITDINDHSPEFVADPYVFGPLQGSELPGHYIGTVQCTDMDIGTNAQVAYNLPPDSTPGPPLFSLDSQSGNISLIGDLDERQFDDITFFVECVDAGSRQMTGSTRVLVSVVEVNGHPPEFTNTSYSVIVPEDTRVFEDVILTVEATDRDTGVSGQVQYSIQDDFDNLFFINEDTGELSLLRTLDFETRMEYALVVQAIDGAIDSPVRMSSSVNVTVEVSGVNEHAPVCRNQVYVEIINQTSVGDILDLECTDDDAGTDGDLVYNILSGDRLFIISTSGGIIITAPILPPLGVEQYALRISISDSGNPSQQIQVDVFLIYSFENLAGPEFDQTVYYLTTSELAEVGEVLTTIVATDTDPSLQGELTYSVTGTDRFRINPTSGEIFIFKPLDHETNPSVQFTVVAEDNDPFFPQSSSALVNVTIQNENDNFPVCELVFYQREILSSAQVSDTVLALDCSDPDGDVLLYQLSGISDSFAVEETTGLVYVTGPLTPSMTTVLNVLVTDSGGNSVEVAAIIQVNFANTMPPAFTTDQYIFNISENAILFSDIGFISATDADSSLTDLTYSIENPEQSPRFFAVSSTGNVVLTAPLDHENEPRYSFMVRVQDSGSFNGSNQLSDVATVIVNVINSNDNLPQLSDGGIYGATVSMGTAEGTTILSIRCTDGDASPYGSPAISNTSFAGVPFELVGINSEYAVRVSGILSETAVYTIDIICTDAGGLSTQGQAFIVVPELDAPIFGQLMYKWTLNESASTGSEYSEIEATSNDGSDITYSFTDGNDTGLFYINPSTGVVSLVGNLDYETDRTHSLVIRATDGESRQSSVLLLVQVLNENEFAPVILPSTVFQVAQNAPIGYPIGVIDCSDYASSSETMFGFAFVPASDTFSVEESGIIRLEGMLDTTPAYALTITCYDANTPDAISTGIVIIEVEFVNQYPPVFDFESYAFSIREDADVQSLVGRVEASDRDIGSFGELSYAILGGNPDAFYVDEETGGISVLTVLDREAVGSYQLTLEAVDGGLSAPDSSRMTGTALVYILVEDVNDNPPVPDQSLYIQSIPTSHAVFTPVLSIQCTDSDLPGNSDITYSLDSDIENFAIQSDGTILLVQEQSAMAVYSFNVICTDNGSPMLSSSSLVTVIVDTVEASAPVFDMESYEATVSEEEPLLSTVLQVRASSSDSSLDIVYTIESGNEDGNFQINPTMGDIILISSLDATQQQQYTLTVQASYTGSSPLSSLTTVAIIVTDVNNNSPVFSTPFYTASINESVALLTPVVQLECTDADLNAEIIYEITDGLTTLVFNITREGLITVASEIDYETETVHTFQVTCTDGRDAPRSTNATVTIEVIPVNDFIPSFSQSVYEFTAPENVFGLLIGRVEATDLDLGNHGRVTYHLLDPGDFSVVFVEPSTGDVLVASNLDYEAQSFWNLTVIARDGAGAESHAFLEITVTNINDVDPIISPQASITTIPFDSPPGFPLQSYSCTDADETGTIISILNGNSLGYFELNGFSQLVWTGTAADLTSDAVVSLTIQCQDIQDPEQRVLAYIAITIRVGDTVPPVFSQEVYQRTVSENTGVGMTVLTVSAIGENEVIYELFNLPVGFPFSVGERSGNISITSPLNREMTLLFVFTVRATDEVSGAVGLALIEIMIGDVNDNTPQLLPLLQSVTLPEDLPPSTPFVSFACSDEDIGTNGEISFQILTGNDVNTFRISENGVVELANPLDFEVIQNYNITVVCSDAGDPSLLASASLLIAVTGVNEHAPQFDRAAYNFMVNENAVAGEVVGMVSASDADTGVDGEVRFEIVFGSSVGFFSVNSVGEIRTTIRSLNATLQAAVELIVRATDGGLLSNDALVTINITDVNEPPVFSSGNYVAVTSTDQPPGTSILDFICYDTDLGDNAHLSLTVADNPSSLDVFIDTENGMGVIGSSIVMSSTIAAGAFELLLRCSDSGIPQLQTDASVTIRVEGVNTPPVFFHGSIAISISENTQPGDLLATVNASDAETGVSYAITGGNGLGTFSLDPMTGDIFLAQSLDYETTRDYGITVTASDESIFNRLSSSIEVFVFVFNTNDLPPLLNPVGIQVITVNENALPVTNTTSYACMDPDGGIVNFSIDPPNGLLSPFGIVQSGSTGTVQLLNPIDFELQTVYTLMVTCTDTPIRSGDVSLQVSATLIVHILPENNYSPEFVSPSFFAVAEDSISGDVIARVQAIDRDNRGQITYSTSSHTDLFLVDLLSGNITLIGELDYEDLQMYTLTIEASDNDNAQGVEPRATNASVEIRVTDANDNRPVCTSNLETVDLLTGTYNFSSLLQFTCLDEDEGQNSVLVYSIESIQPSNLTGEFVLNNTTGELGFTGTITLADTIVIQILVSDSGDEPLTTRVTVIVQVESSEVTQPRFEPNQFSVTISENTERDTIVLNGTILQSALRNPLGADVQYTQRTNPLYGNTFTIDSATGDIVLSSTNQFDFDEGLQVYSLIVEAMVGDDIANAVVNIVLTDYNDNAPRFEAVVFEAVVRENQPSGTSIVQVQADDIDSGMNGEFRFMTEDSADFDVDPFSGQVTTIRVLDRERQDTFSLVVFAVDLGSPQQTGSTLVSITVEDENDVSPQFASSIYTVNINNLSPPGAPILTLDVIDEDVTGIFAFRIITSDQEVRDLFTVDSPAGILRQRAVAIPEDHAPQYEFMVEVNDEIATHTTTIVIYVFSITSVTTFFEENTLDEMFDIQNFLLQQTFDISVNATYEVTGGDEFSEFNITENGVLRSINVLDRENIPEYSLSVNVQDLATTENVDVRIRVIVVDQNDNAPIFLEHSYLFSLQEGTYREKTIIGAVEAVDADEPGSANSLIEFSLVAASDEFSIEAMTGRICALGSFDRETKSEITFTVRARDFGGPDPEISYADVTVQITDSNDNNPRFEPPDVLYFVVETLNAMTPANTMLTMITAVLPGEIEIRVQAFEYTDPDSSSVIRSSLEVIQGENKYQLSDIGGNSNRQVLLTTAEITIRDDGTILQIVLYDEPLDEETNPITKEIRIVSNVSTTLPSVIPPTTRGQNTQPPTFFETEFGIAVIAVICVLIVALVFFLCCLFCYCGLRFRREKDPLSSRLVVH